MTTQESENLVNEDQYVYQDWSNAAQEQADKLSIERENTLHPFALRFPTKLSKMLQNEELSGVIEWMPHGRSWIILDRDRFAKDVLPVYFEHANFTSFNRLVNAWGFRRIPSGPDSGSYYHELFLRDMPHLHVRMRRLLLDERKAPIDKDNRCPNFYEMPLSSPNSSEAKSKQEYSKIMAARKQEILRDAPNREVARTSDAAGIATSEHNRPGIQNENPNQESNNESIIPMQGPIIRCNPFSTTPHPGVDANFCHQNSQNLSYISNIAHQNYAAYALSFNMMMNWWKNQFMSLRYRNCFSQPMMGQNNGGIMQAPQETHTNYLPQANNASSERSSQVSASFSCPRESQHAHNHQLHGSPIAFSNIQIMAPSVRTLQDGTANQQHQFPLQQRSNFFWITNTSTNPSSSGMPPTATLIVCPAPRVRSSFGASSPLQHDGSSTSALQAPTDMATRRRDDV